MKRPAALAIICMITFSTCTRSPLSGDHQSWKQYGGSADQSKFVVSPGITRENVNRMQVAWVYPSSDSLSYMFSPIVADTLMYVFAKNNSLICLHALTGKEIWIHANLQ